MTPALDGIEAKLCQGLDLPVLLRSAKEPLLPDSLTPAERETMAGFRMGERSRDWSRGRAALKQVLNELALGTDTTHLVWPHPRLSLSHTKTLAVALGACAEDNRGLGVDIEYGRMVATRAARFFLTDAELGALGALPTDALLRLWTVKEALFKADRHNRGCVLTHYEVANPFLEEGTATNQRGETFRYCSVPLETGWISAARSNSKGETTDVADHR